MYIHIYPINEPHVRLRQAICAQCRLASIVFTSPVPPYIFRSFYDHISELYFTAIQSV